MINERLSPAAVKRVSGASWEALRPLFFQVSDTLLNVNLDSVGVLTTIYVKFQTSPNPSSPVFAVAWLKPATQLVLGLALPDHIESRLLEPAPKGMTYKGLTKYLVLKPGDSMPNALSVWAATAYESVVMREE
jgi:hypothetical protein